MALPTFDELMAQAAKHVVTPQPDPALIQAMTRNSQERQVNMPIALGAMLSGDRGMQGVGGLMYKDAREANNLIPLGDEGFIDPTSGTFMASPVAQSRRQQRVLDLAMRQANSNDQKMLSAANAAASREQAQLLRQAQIEREDAYRKEQLEIQRQNADTRAVAAAAAAEAAKARADAAAQGARIPVGQQMELNAQRTNIKAFEELAAGFKDSFGGSTFNTVGDIKAWMGRTGVNDSYKELGNWWQAHQDLFNQQLRILSGAAVTASEAVRFEKSSVTPGMSPDMIRTRLAQQQRILAEAQNSLLSSLKQNGYNTAGYPDLRIPDNTQAGTLQGQPTAPTAPASSYKVERLE